INSVLTIMFLFLIANLGYQMALIIYDSMLPFIAEKHHIGKASGFGIAIGYFGSIIGILLSFLLIPIYGDFAIEPGNTLSEVGVFTLGYIPYIYPLAAIMFLLFSLPLFLFVKEHEREIPKREFGIRKEVISQVKVTAGEIRKYKSMFWFLIGWLIFVDAANTVIAFMTDIVQVGLEFGESKIALIVLFLGVIFAVLGTYPIGMYVDRKGPRKGLLLVTLLWTSAILVAFFTNLQIGESRTPEFMVYLVGMLSGPAIGGTWVVQRQYVIELAPIQKIGNYFGFTNIFGRVSAAVGPLIWATSVYIFGLLNFNSNMSTRISILILGIIMIFGFYIIYSKVEDVHDHFLNGARANGKGEWIDEDGNVVFKSN
ncbi:MAG: MFS transporter, partial [Candidatus Heimdallarchaeota archaeon]